MLRSHWGKSTARKPLGDVSNGGGNLRRPRKKESPAASGNDAGGLDRLLLVRSDLANLVGQIDEVVAHAIEHKTISKKGSNDIDNFRQFLSDMHSSLKPWLLRLQEATTTPDNSSKDVDSNPCANVHGDLIPSKRNDILKKSMQNDSELELEVSPSPLVSWRVGACTVDCGKQLFLLTPLPKTNVHSVKLQESSKSFAGKFNGQNQSNAHVFLPLPSSSTRVHDDQSGSEVVQTSDKTLEGRILSPFSFSKKKIKQRSVYLLTPCFAKNPAVLNPIPETFQSDGCNTSKLVVLEKDAKELEDPSSDELNGSLASKYQDLLGLQAASKFTGRRREVDETLDWFLSPPKTCVLMEPSDEKPLPTPANSRAAFGTPFWKEFESTRKGNPPGEATLKRELWTKFDAASSSGLQFDVSVFQKTEKKGFLDRLEEVSCETTDFDLRAAR